MVHGSIFSPTVIRTLTLVWIATICPAGCGNESYVQHSVHPEIVEEWVEPNPNSTISAVFVIRAMRAGSVRIEITGDPDGRRTTRDFVLGDEAVRVPLLGLLADTAYQFRAVLTSDAGVETVRDWLPFRTGPLPDSIARINIVEPGDGRPRLTLLSPRRSVAGPPHPAVIIDGAGRVVWYREPSSILTDFQVQPNGHLTAAVSVAAPGAYSAGTYVEWDALGGLVNEWIASGSEFTDAHELRLLDDGSALLLGFESRSVDVARFGGNSDGVVVGGVLQHLAPDRQLLFEWRALDHYALDDADDFVWAWGSGSGQYDFTHCNAIEHVPNGDYLLSSRHLSEITRIDGETGEIRWRMGKGKANQFKFVNDPKDGFWNMHAVRRLPNGHLIFIDNGNGHMPPSSRAVEYEIDEEAKIATLVWSFEPGIFSCCMGYAQRLPNGNTLVNLGQDYRVFEVTRDGDVVWEADLPDKGAGFSGIYRAMRISSLDDLR